MTDPYSGRHQQNPTGTGRFSGENLRRAIVMAVVLCVGIAGGLMLAAGYKDRAPSYEAHAAGYLTEQSEAVPAVQAPAATLVAGTPPVCQEYTKKVTIGGETQTIYGTACRQPDGTWDIVQ